MQDVDGESLKYYMPLRSILIFGPPGSGKGTQGRFIREVGGAFHLSTGEIFRGIDRDSPKGQLVKEYADKGRLIPDEETVSIWASYVSGLVATNRYFPKKQLLLLDGIPRTVKQVSLISEYIDVVKIIVLECPDHEKLIQRMVKRGSIEGRVDDQDAAILKRRFEVYAKETEEIIKLYPEKLIERFDGMRPAEEVSSDILSRLSSILK